MYKKGDTVTLKKPFIHYSTDLGGRTGTIVDITGYLLVEIFNYEDNPVKCFISEIEGSEKMFEESEIDNLLNNFDPDNFF